MVAEAMVRVKERRSGHPAALAWERPGSDVYWNEQNQQLRAMLLKRDEELRELQVWGGGGGSCPRMRP